MHASIFLFVVPPVRLSAFTYPRPLFHFPPFFRFPFPSLSLRQRSPPPLLRMWPQPCILSYATVSNLHEDTGKLRKTCADTVGHFTESVPSQQSLKKMTSCSTSRYAGREPGGHPSKYWASAKLLDLGAVDTYAPITHRTLSVTSMLVKLKKKNDCQIMYGKVTTLKSIHKP